jgi:hypothetical protein
MNRTTANRIAAGAALGGALAVYALAIRPWYLRWGATDDEFEGFLPGDDFTPDANWTTTHAVTIEAPASEVWPWIVQVGQDKGGFYSYTWLENMVGCNMHNADRIVPEYQHVAVGDELWLHPKAPPLPVVLVEAERALVMGGNTDEAGTWGFYLKSIGPNRTRLIARGRTAREPGSLRWLGHHVLFEPAHFVMERRMLLGIKERAERARSRASVLDRAALLT